MWVEFWIWFLTISSPAIWWRSLKSVGLRCWRFKSLGKRFKLWKFGIKTLAPYFCPAKLAFCKPIFFSLYKSLSAVIIKSLSANIDLRFFKTCSIFPASNATATGLLVAKWIETAVAKPSATKIVEESLIFLSSIIKKFPCFFPPFKKDFLPFWSINWRVWISPLILNNGITILLSLVNFIPSISFWSVGFEEEIFIIKN